MTILALASGVNESFVREILGQGLAEHLELWYPIQQQYLISPSNYDWGCKKNETSLQEASNYGTFQRTRSTPGSQLPYCHRDPIATLSSL